MQCKSHQLVFNQREKAEGTVTCPLHQHRLPLPGNQRLNKVSRFLDKINLVSTLCQTLAISAPTSMQGGYAVMKKIDIL